MSKGGKTRAEKNMWKWEREKSGGAERCVQRWDRVGAWLGIISGCDRLRTDSAGFAACCFCPLHLPDS